MQTKLAFRARIGGFSNLVLKLLTQFRLWLMTRLTNCFSKPINP